jgi:GntR family transcriptional regulator/MocR family aminotransferase
LRFVEMTRAPRGVLPVIAIDRESRIPLYRQIYEGYRRAILERRLHAGERLPATRALAEALGVSRLPVLNAFDQLVTEGYCESRVGAGTFVADALPEELDPRPRPASGSMPAVPPGARPLAGGPASEATGPPFWLLGTGPFTIGGTAREHFPFRTWATLVARHARTLQPDDLRYGDRMGLKAFREAIAAYLRVARGVRCEADQVMVVNGSQQALELTARALIDPGSPVWFEDPGYWGARAALTAAGARLEAVPVDAEGLDVAGGIARCPEARAVFVTPSHQFPLGTTMTASRRLQLLRWAQRAGAWIIEDDYNSEYRYESLPITALQGLDLASRVIYIGTFSKVLAPALRIGYLVLPPDLVEHCAAIRGTMDISPPSFMQAVLTEFLTDGHFARHLRRTSKLYRERRSVLVEALRSELGDGVEVLGAQAGLHLVVTLPAAVDDHEVAARAAREGLRVMPLSWCFLGPQRRPGLVLGYGDTRVEEIPNAVRRLRRALSTVMAPAV